MASSHDDAGDELMELAVEFWLRRIAEAIHAISRFDFALIGVLEAVDYSSMHSMTIDDVPKRRSFEYLMTSSRALASFPRNISSIRKY
jgi:hypothetical protein